MRYPNLVPDRLCKTPITLTIEGEGLTEDGAPIELLNAQLYCNYQDGGKTIFTEQQKMIEISGTAFFNGDICPEIPNITSGTGIIFGEEREIHSGYKRRNPDGTVNFTEIRFK